MPPDFPGYNEAVEVMSFQKGPGDGRRARIYFLALAVCACLLFLAGLGKRPLRKSDEPRVAGIAAEMARSGELIVPRLNSEPFLEKPPLYFWTLSAVFNLLGENSYTAKIPSALAAIVVRLLSSFWPRVLAWHP